MKKPASKALTASKAPRASTARGKLDNLTDQERSLVRARLAHPTFQLFKLARVAGMRGPKKRLEVAVSKTLARPQVRTALLHPPPELSPIKSLSETFDPEDAIKAKKQLVKWLVEIIEDRKNVAQSERIRCIDTLASMTPAAKVPVGVHHTGGWTLEKFVEAAGGKPPDLPGVESNARSTPGEMPN